MNTLSTLSPRKMVDFITKITSNDNFRKKIESDPESALAEFGISMPETFNFKKNIKLPPKEKMIEKVGNYLKGEHFSFPATINAQAGFPLIFVITVIFVLIPANISTPQQES